MTPPAGNIAATISVKETLALLDGSFKSMADGIANGHYTFWLGSGISLGRVENLRLLVRRVLLFLQEKIDNSTASCRFKKALNDAFDLIQMPQAEKDAIDFTVPIDNWSSFDSIVSQLASVYSKFLDVRVSDEKPDYLLWEAVDVCRTYADSGLEPDSEHLCVSILAMEGVLSNIASANWDGLIETAATELCGGTEPIVRVCVRGQDLQEPERRVSLLKFHGCAVKAREDETHFRQFLVAREPQIIGWINDPAHAAICHHLIGLLMTHRTLVMGLSAQDFDIKYVFDKAKTVLHWSWPSVPPAYVFAENTLGPDQLTVLRIVYGEDPYAANAAAIDTSALIHAYAKQLLIALVLQVLFLKLSTLLRLGLVSLLPAADQDDLVTSLREMRDRVAENAGPDTVSFMRDLVAQSGRLLTIFRSASGNTADRYYPLGTVPVSDIATDPSLSTSGLSGLSIALALLQLGHQMGFWVILLPAHSGPDAGVLRVATSTATRRIFFAANGHVALRLRDAGYMKDEDPDALVISSFEMIPRAQRSPSAAPGRTGKQQARCVGIEDLLRTVSTKDELLQRFREELVL